MGFAYCDAIGELIYAICTCCPHILATMFTTYSTIYAQQLMMAYTNGMRIQLWLSLMPHSLDSLLIIMISKPLCHTKVNNFMLSLIQTGLEILVTKNLLLVWLFYMLVVLSVMRHDIRIQLLRAQLKQNLL